MFPVSTTHAARWPALLAALALGGAVLAQETYKPGDPVEYRVRGSDSSETWERGVIVRSSEGGKQYIVREKSSKYYPEGFQRAYNPEDLRTPRKAATDPKTAADPKSAVDSKKAIKVEPPADGGDGLLSKEDVLAFAKKTFGPGVPFADSKQREINLNTIRDHIKARGTDFVADTPFDDAMGGMHSVSIGYAIKANYGKHPKLKDYLGTWYLRPVQYWTRDFKDTVRVYEGGILTIDADGTYEWKDNLGGKARVVEGKWREAKSDEMAVWEGGLAVWLEKAREGRNYMARMARHPDYLGCIEVGDGKGRTGAVRGRKM